MASPSRWRRRKEARPAEILKAALVCFAERGFAATRLDDVARRAGISKGTLYLYFANKEELFKAVVRQAIVANLAREEERIGAATEPASVLLAQVLGTWVARLDSPVSAIPKLVLAEAGNFPDLARFYLEEVIHRAHGLIGRILRTGIARGEFRPVEIESAVNCAIAPMLLAMLWHHSFAAHEPGGLDPEALCRTHLTLFCQGLLRPGQDAPAGEAGAGGDGTT